MVNIMERKGALIAGIIISALFISGCNCCTKLTGPELSRILENEWLAYKKNKPNFDGGLALQILSPKGDYFASTGLGDKVTDKFHFRTASVTKTFTAAAIMLLEQRGLLNIDDKITSDIPGKKIPYLPNTADYNIPYKKNITIRMLLMHRAGVFDVTNNEIPDNKFSHGKPYVGRNYLDYMLENDRNHTFTFDELVGVNVSNQLSFFVPGSAYHYSDTGYSILGKIIERVSGRSYSEFIKEELLVPNRLLDTSSPWKGSDQTMPEPFIRGYVWVNNTLEDTTISNMSAHVAEGNITTTPIDLANWGRKLLTAKAGLTKESVEKMKSGMSKDDDTDSTYGLGLGYSPEGGYGHAGAHAGYLSLMTYNPKTDVVYVMVANVWNCRTCAKNLDSIMDEFKAMVKAANKVLKKIGY